MKPSTAFPLLLGALLAAAPAFAAEPDVSTLYELSSAGTTAAFKAAESGKVVLEIKCRPGAHVSDEAPLKIELKGQGVAPAKEKLTLADSVGKKAPGQEYADPRFEVALKADKPGKGQVDAKLTFFICTDKICARQQKTLSLPVEAQ